MTPSLMNDAALESKGGKDGYEHVWHICSVLLRDSEGKQMTAVDRRRDNYGNSRACHMP